MFNCEKMKSIFFVFLLVICTTHVVFTQHPWYPDENLGERSGRTLLNKKKQRDAVSDTLVPLSDVPVDHHPILRYAVLPVPLLTRPKIIVSPGIIPSPNFFDDHDTFPTPVFPTPVFPPPVFPTPEFPTPLFPTPIFPPPVYPTPVFPTPEFPTPVFPPPVYPTPKFPTPVFPSRNPWANKKKFITSVSYTRVIKPSSRRIVRIPLKKVSGRLSDILFPPSDSQVNHDTSSDGKVEISPYNARSLLARRSQPNFVVNDALVALSDSPVDHDTHPRHTLPDTWDGVARAQLARASSRFLSDASIPVSDSSVDHDGHPRHTLPDTWDGIGRAQLARSSGRILPDASIPVSDSPVDHDGHPRHTLPDTWDGIGRAQLARSSGRILSDASIPVSDSPVDHDGHPRHTLPDTWDGIGRAQLARSLGRILSDASIPVSDSLVAHDTFLRQTHRTTHPGHKQNDALDAVSDTLHDHDTLLRNSLHSNSRRLVSSRPISTTLNYPLARSLKNHGKQSDVPVHDSFIPLSYSPVDHETLLRQTWPPILRYPLPSYPRLANFNQRHLHDKPLPVHGRQSDAVVSDAVLPKSNSLFDNDALLRNIVFPPLPRPH
ncbi:uncharacterized protein [Diabrotica undecimpunctata]|uniref:uncharacterized protein n=1 Tax=Diabrotica undecimpunctata TaxID=50387 RepID=UPI003B638157